MSKNLRKVKDVSCVPYASVVGSQNLTMVCTRPNISHVVAVLSRYMSKQGKEHWTPIKRIFIYLCGTLEYESTTKEDIEIT